jgi:hypothetical protein
LLTQHYVLSEYIRHLIYESMDAVKTE